MYNSKSMMMNMYMMNGMKVMCRMFMCVEIQWFLKVCMDSACEWQNREEETDGNGLQNQGQSG